MTERSGRPPVLAELPLGEHLVAVRELLDAASDAWKCAGFPESGPTVVKREEAFYELHKWNHRANGAGVPLTPDACGSCANYARLIAAAKGSS